MRKNLFTLIFPFLCLAVCAQNRPDTLRDVYRSFYFPQQDLILYTHDDGYSLSSPDKPNILNRKKIQGWQPKMAGYDFHLNGGQLLLIDKNDQSIHEISGDSIVLRERVTHPKVFINSILLRYQDDLYFFGGYGLWSNRRFLLRLNESFRWEPVVFNRQSGDTEETAFPPGIHTGTFAVIGERALLFKGHLVDKNDALVNPYNSEVWELDIKKPRWTKLGLINRSIFRAEMENQIILSGDNRTFLLPDSRAVAELESNGKTIRLYTHTLSSSEMLNNDVYRFMGFIRKGKVHYHFPALKADESPDGKEAVVHRVIPLSEFLGKPIGQDVLYTSTIPFNFYWLLIPLGMLAAYAGFRIIRKQRQPALLELTADGLLYRTVLHELEPPHIALLKRLLESNDPVSSNDLTAIIRNPNLKYSHNNRVKNEIISQLNLQFKSILNVRQDLITSTISDQDKRFRWYRIDLTYFKV